MPTQREESAARGSDRGRLFAAEALYTMALPPAGQRRFPEVHLESEPSAS
jgi:hypothetical protein